MHSYEMITDFTLDEERLVETCRLGGAWIQSDSFGLQPFEGMGCGAVALTDIAVNCCIIQC